jgi:hypothetical protein
MGGGNEGETPRQKHIAVTKLFEEKGLFKHHTPKGADPKWYPLDAMSDLLEYISIKAEQEGQEEYSAEKLAAWEKSVRKLKMAYEIIACPYLDYPPYVKIIELSVRDAQNHPNINSREYPHRAPIELNAEEQSILSKLTLGRGLPFDPKKRVYRYSSLSNLFDAENIVFDVMVNEHRQIEDGNSDGPPRS